MSRWKYEGDSSICTLTHVRRSVPHVKLWQKAPNEGFGGESSSQPEAATSMPSLVGLVH